MSAVPHTGVGPRKIRFRDPQVEMAHGAGGKASRRMIDGLFAPLLYGDATGPLGDAAYINVGTGIAMTTDAFVVRPLSFPGGSVGELAVNGTVNDLAVAGARAEALVVSYILEAGLDTRILEAEVRAMAAAAARAGVAIVSGDTKVVEHGKADQMYITTAGVGRAIPGIGLSAASVQAGDRVLLSGPIGDHGITILLARGDLDLEADLRSDTRSVLPLVEALAGECGAAIRWMRDPTRGGVATSLNELARDCGLGIQLSEDLIPIRDAVRGACELLGLDPLHIANEGQFLTVVARESAEQALAALRRTPGGEEAAIIGEVREQASGCVTVITPYGGSRIVDMLVGDPLPRDLLGAISRVPRSVENRLLKRNQIFEDFFSRESHRLALACREMSERFLKGGRLLAFGKGPYATDAQHVAVEFVHPVIVGKRALPALDLSMAFDPWVKVLARPEDIAMGFGPPEGDPEIEWALEAAASRGAMTFALPGTSGTYFLEPPSSHPFMHQELIEILYHTLWETVHVFFEHRELGQDIGASAFLYPFLGEEKQETGSVVEQVAASIRDKVRADADLRQRVAEEQAPQIAAAAEAIHGRLGRGGKLILFGNGGSATDANDWAMDCILPPAGYRPIPAISLGMEPASLTAIANDVGFDLVFLRQVIAHVRPDDVAVGISTSGGSKNIILALEEARKRGALTLGLLGYDGGEIVRRGLADFNLVVHSDYIPRIQEVQASMYHLLRESLEALNHAEI